MVLGQGLGKAHVHGGNIQAVLAPDGFPLWVSDVQPGSVHDITAARAHALPPLYHAAAAGLPTLADPGYDGAGIGIHVPVRQPPGGQDLDIDTRTRNALLRSLRCLGERGFALLTGRWRTLQHITASHSKIGDIAPRRLDSDPFRARLHHMNFAEITSVPFNEHDRSSVILGWFLSWATSVRKPAGAGVAKSVGHIAGTGPGR